MGYAVGPRCAPRCCVLSRPDSGNYRVSLRPCITTPIAPRRRATFHQAVLGRADGEVGHDLREHGRLEGDLREAGPGALGSLVC
jgi:hypothetical protein